jgi:hypothetical protein
MHRWDKLPACQLFRWDKLPACQCIRWDKLPARQCIGGISFQPFQLVILSLHGSRDSSKDRSSDKLEAYPTFKNKSNSRRTQTYRKILFYAVEKRVPSGDNLATNDFWHRLTRGGSESTSNFLFEARSSSMVRRWRWMRGNDSLPTCTSQIAKLSI